MTGLTGRRTSQVAVAKQASDTLPVDHKQDMPPDAELVDIFVEPSLDTGAVDVFVG